jgi:hypothetical protein
MPKMAYQVASITAITFISMLIQNRKTTKIKAYEHFISDLEF